MRVDKFHFINEHPLQGGHGRIRTVLQVNGNEKNEGQFYFIYREILWPDKMEWERHISPDGRIKMRPMEMLEVMSIMAKVHADFISRKLAKIREKHKKTDSP